MPINKNPQFPIVSLGMILVLGILTASGSFDAKTVSADQFTSNKLTPYEKNISIDYFKNLANDTKIFLKDFKKTTLFNLDSEIDKEIIPKIENVKMELTKMKVKESELQSIIDSYPNEDYYHNKLELSSFMVDKLKNQGLVYELVYNYQEYVEEIPTDGSEPVDTVTETQGFSGFSNKFLIRVYKINEGDNYTKLANVLDDIYIKESYEIENLSMKFDVISKSYYLEFIVEI